MNTNPNAVRVLCFGDSNTWAQRAEGPGCYSVDVRWTGLLQEKLGDTYEVIEEGFPGRTTDLDSPDPDKPGRNGLTYLRPCLRSHSPFDIFVIMLGTNDLKVSYGRTADDVAQALERLLNQVPDYAFDRNDKIPSVVVVSPIHIDPSIFDDSGEYEGILDKSSVKESHRFAKVFGKLAQAKGFSFVDAARVAKPGKDGLHVDQASQEPLAQAIADAIRK